MSLSAAGIHTEGTTAGQMKIALCGVGIRLAYLVDVFSAGDSSLEFTCYCDESPVVCRTCWTAAFASADRMLISPRCWTKTTLIY